MRTNAGLDIVDWEDAIAAAAQVTEGHRLVVLASPNLSNESLFLLERMIAERNGAGVFRLTRGDEAALPGVNDLALRAERAANATGARALGFSEVSQLTGTPHDGDVLRGGRSSMASRRPNWRASAIVYIGTGCRATQARVAVVLGGDRSRKKRTAGTRSGRSAHGAGCGASHMVCAGRCCPPGGNGRFYLPSEVLRR